MMESFYHRIVDNLTWLEAFAFVGQLAFSGRFLVQWIASERKGQSVVPDAFWYLSLAGSSILLAYSIAITKPALIVGFLFNNIVYIRNLVLIHRHRRSAAGAGAQQGA